MTRILSLDTTSKHISIALAEDDNVIQEYNFKSHQELSSILIPSISWILARGGLTIHDIDLFGICIGPGLFTGIRIGLTTLKGLVFQTPKPIVPVTSLEALASKQQSYKHCRTIVPLIDAKRDEIYMAGFDNTGQYPQETTPPRLLHIEELDNQVKDMSEPYFMGSGVEAHMEKLAGSFGAHHLLCRSPYLAAEICRIAQREFLAGQSTTNLQEIVPLYIRIPDAQQNHEKSLAKDNIPKSPS